MKIGSAITLLVVALIALGYLLSNNINTYQDLTELRRANDQLVKEKQAIEEQLNRTVTEVIYLKQQNEALSQEKLRIEAQAAQAQSEYLLVKDQNIQLQNQLKSIQTVDSIIGELNNLDPKSLMLALVVPILPLSVVSSLLIYRKGKLHNRSTGGKVTTSNRILSMQVTDEEMKLIRQMRRNE